MAPVWDVVDVNVFTSVTFVYVCVFLVVYL